MQKKISIGIDIGTQNTRIIVLGDEGNNVPKVISSYSSVSRGLRHGYITKTKDASQSVREAFKNIEKMFVGTKLPKICVSVGGTGLSGNIFQSSLPLLKSQMEVTDEDISRVSESGRSDMPQAFALNRRIIHSFPLQYKIDGRVVQGKPHGLKGSRLEARTLFVTCLNHHINDILEAIEDAGASVDNIVSTPIARGNLLLTRVEKVAGVALLDIGLETTSLVVFEDGLPISLEVYPGGANDITNDLALGLKIDLNEAEETKRGVARIEHPKKKVDEIIKNRLEKIFAPAEEHLKKIGKNGLLPAGIILCGGGAEVAHIEAVAKSYFKLPARRIEERVDSGLRTQLKISEWGGAYGAALFNLSDEDEESFGLKLGLDLGKKFSKDIWSWIKQFLP